jgi:hypothetical protein
MKLSNPVFGKCNFCNKDKTVVYINFLAFCYDCAKVLFDKFYDTDIKNIA